MTSVVLVHGLGGTAATMAPLADSLRAAGHDARSVTLPGHGTVAEDLVGVTWAQWLAAVPGADVIVGQSMGATLALARAGELDGRVRAVVAINPSPPDPDAVDGLEWRQSRGHDWIDGPALADGEVGYTRFPVGALLEMARGAIDVELALVTCPVLLVTSEDDDVVDPTSADVIAAAVRGPVTRLVLPRGGHVATLGPERDTLSGALLDFVSRLP